MNPRRHAILFPLLAFTLDKPFKHPDTQDLIR